MKRTTRTVQVADPIWEALEAMSREMDVDPDSLVNQALYTLARINGFIVPPKTGRTDPSSVAPAVTPEEVVDPADVRVESAAIPANGAAGLQAPVADVPSAVPLPAPMPQVESVAAHAEPLRAEPAVDEMRAKAAEQVRSIVADAEQMVLPQPDAAPEADEEDAGDDEAEASDGSAAAPEEAQASAGADVEDEREEPEGEDEPSTGEEELPDEAAQAEPSAAIGEAAAESDSDGDIPEPEVDEFADDEGAPESEPEAEEDAALERLVAHPVLQKPPASLERAGENPFSDRTILQAPRPRLFLQVRTSDPIEVVAERFLIGRGNHCNLVIDSVRVSREHAVLRSEGDGFVLEDLGSSNGTWLGTRRLQRHLISDGDIVLLGNEKVRFSVRGPGAPA